MPEGGNIPPGRLAQEDRAVFERIAAALERIAQVFEDRAVNNA